MPSRCAAPSASRWVLPVAALVLALAPACGCSTLANLPRHPQSTVPLQGPADIPNPVDWIWAGALTPTSIRVNARLSQDSDRVRLLVSSDAGLAPGATLVSGAHTADLATNNRVVSITMDGLEPETPYVYAIEADGAIDRVRTGTFRTPAVGPQSFNLVFGSCARTGSNGTVFETMRAHAPLFTLHLGDLHYENIRRGERARFRRAFNRVLRAPAQARLYRSAPIAYMWDDHDYGPNDADATSESRKAARLAYQTHVPHYPLPAGEGNVPIYQAFTIGRVRFILCDLRSERMPDGAPEGGAKTLMGARQKAWFKQELLAAQGNRQLVVWVSTVPWIDPADPDTDTWGGYSTERAELAGFIEHHGLSGIVMLSGDAHMLAIDDGSNNRYGPSGGRGFPVMHAAAFDKGGRVKGGPYSVGVEPGGGHFGLLEVEDTGGRTIRVRLSGRDFQDRELMQLEVEVDTEALAPPPVP